jgi:hypothetical protein
VFVFVIFMTVFVRDESTSTILGAVLRRRLGLITEAVRSSGS